MRKPAATLAGTGLLFLALSLAAPAAARANEQVYNGLLPATVWVKADLGPGQTSFGSGVLVDAQRRWVVTNYHVVEQQNNVRVFFPVRQNGDLVVQRNFYDKNESALAIPGRVITRDNLKDLAVIELGRLPQDARPVKMAPSSAHNAQDLHVIGNPKGAALWVYTAGKVRSVYDKQWNVALETGKLLSLNARVVETDLAINAGDSGGPVVNNKTELVALVASYQKDQRLVSTCIDVSEIRTILARAQAGIQVAQTGDKEAPQGGEKPAGTGQPNAKVDPRVAKLLDETSYNGKYTVIPEGAYKIDIKPKSPFVFVESVTSTYKGVTVRRVWAIGKIYEGPPPADLNLKLLLANSNRIFGAWSVLNPKNTNKHALLFVRNVPLNISAGELQATIEIVHANADDVAQGRGIPGIQVAVNPNPAGPGPGKEPIPAPGPDKEPGGEPKPNPQVPPGQFSLAGTWKAVSFANNTKIDWTMTVNDKQISLKVDNGQGNPQTVKGTYSISPDKKLAIVVGDKTNDLGKLSWQNANSFTVDDGTLKLTFNKADAGVAINPQPGGQGNFLNTTWIGSENLQGYNKLTFKLNPGGKATMIDSDGTTQGTWTQKGNQVTLVFHNGNCVYTGNIVGQNFTGSGRLGNGRTWTFTLKMQ